MNSNDEKMKQDISHLWPFDEKNETKVSDSVANDSKKVNPSKGDLLTSPMEVIFTRSQCAFSLVPPFKSSRGRHLGLASDDYSLSNLSDVNLATGDINMLAIGGHIGDTTYLTAFGNPTIGFFIPAIADFYHEFTFDLPLSSELNLKAELKPGFPKPIPENKVFQLMNSPYRSGPFAISGELRFTVKAFNSGDDQIAVNTVPLNFLSCDNSFDPLKWDYLVNAEVENTLKLPVGTVRVELEIRIEIRSLVPENYDGQTGLSGNHYALIDFLDPLYPLHEFDLQVPKAGNGCIRIDRIDCELSDIYCIEDDHRTD